MAVVELMKNREIIVARDPETGVTTVTVRTIATDGVSLFPLSSTDTLDSPSDSATIYSSLNADIASQLNALTA